MIDQARKIFTAITEAWHGFWFTPTDPIVVSALRVVVGGMLFYTLLVWGVDLEAFFLQHGGWQSAELVGRLQADDWAQSFWWLVPDRYLWHVHLSCLVIVGMFWIGLATPVTKWLTLVIMISYCNRVPLANYGLDQLNIMLNLYLCLGPCGARLSADRWIHGWRSKSSGRIPTSPAKSLAAGLTVRMVQVHMCIVYFCAGLSKLQGETWWNGTAVWRAAANYEYQQFSLTWLAEVPWLYQISTIGTWLWEISFAFLIWNRFCRLPVLLIGISMHIGIGMFMGMWTFGLIMCFAYVTFIPAKYLYAVLSSLRLVKDVPRGSMSQVPENLPESRSLVVYVDPNLRSRLKLSQDLRRCGYRCVGVDAWPEAIEISQAVHPTNVLCEASALTEQELQDHVDQLVRTYDDGNLAPRCIALVERNKISRALVLSDSLIVVPLPIRSDDLGALLEGHVPMHMYEPLDISPRAETRAVSEVELSAPTEILEDTTS